MSYCRWGSDDFQCDVYCYDDVYGGITTHVASRRVVFKRPLPPAVPFPMDPKNRRGMAKWKRRHRVAGKLRRRATLVRIGLPFDGQTFNDDEQGFLDRLLALREVGYNVPDYAIEAARGNLDEKDTRD